MSQDLQHVADRKEQLQSNTESGPSQTNRLSNINGENKTLAGIRLYGSEIENVIGLYREGERSKFAVISTITRWLGEDGDLSDQEKIKSLEFYLAEINTVQVGARVMKRKAEDEHPSARERKAKILATATNTSVEGDWTLTTKKTHRQKQICAADMPWNNRKEESSIPRNPSCTKTVEIIRKLNQDIESVKFDIRLAHGAPHGIPMSEWEHIFKGEAVDLDKILSSLHCLGKERRVSTGFEWASAWRSASQATAFVFEHRKQELADYGEYIQDLFEAKQASLHEQVILFDKNLRNEVGGGQTILLTDYDYFAPLYSATLRPDGVLYRRAKIPVSRGGRPSGPKKEVCFRFNGQAGCRATESACKFRHVCQVCGQTGHGKLTCR